MCCGIPFGILFLPVPAVAHHLVYAVLCFPAQFFFGLGGVAVACGYVTGPAGFYGVGDFHPVDSFKGLDYVEDTVSVAGAIGFIGLIIPHITRFLVGVDYRWIIPCSAVLGAVLLIYADIAARLVNPPFETPVGAVTALVGVPFFLYLARRERSGL